MLDRITVIDKVEKEVKWWIEQRKKKLREVVIDTMSFNPLLAPVIFELHNLSTFEELGEFLIAGHLLVGHSTGFGKLVDEKILPNVFGTQKLDKSYRAKKPPLNESCFDEIDHVINKDKKSLLSLKASRWTIQLTMAVQLNKAFDEILQKHKDKYDEIVVGVYYGTNEGLTDKYDILRGINRGAKHDVIDLTENVKVLAGKEFWKWLNDGEEETQRWVLEGILKGLNNAESRAECSKLLETFTASFNERYKQYIDADGKVNWAQLLTDISG